MKKSNQYIMTLFLCLSLACHKIFDEPPPYTGTDASANLSIRDLRKMHFPGNYEKITGDYLISGIVIADDSHDNFYKSIVIQDSTAGITILLNGSGLCNTYPAGAKIFIKLAGLWLGDYAGMVQVGAGVNRSDPAYPELIAIPQPLFDTYLLIAGMNNIVKPVIVRLDELTDSLQSCLVTVANVEMPPNDTGKPYADPVNKLSVNRVIRQCGGGSAYLRTGGYALFAGNRTPRGNGPVTAVYTVFKTEKQLIIRDTSDVQMTGLRCTGSGPRVLLTEDFEAGTNGTDLAIKGWKNIPENGGKMWQVRATSQNTYAEMNAFATSQATVVSWLVSPPVNLSNSANEVLTFKTRDAFDNGAALQVYISTNYDGGNTPWKAKWTALKTTIAKGDVAGVAQDWVSSGRISLGGFQGSVYIAFRYEGTDPANQVDKRTTTFQLDDVKIEGN